MTKSVRYFNLHNLLLIRVETGIEYKMAQIMNHLSVFETYEILNREPDINILDYEALPNMKFDKVIDGSYFYGQGSLNVPKNRLCFNFTNNPLIVYCDRLLIPLNFLVHLALIRKGYCLIHSAAVEFKGRRYLFPAFGGIGKTTLVSAVLFKDGKLYGDDMNIINAEKIYSYPLDFSVYPYHLKLLQIKDAKIEWSFRNTAILNKITDFFEKIHWKPLKLLIIAFNMLKVNYVNVSPKKIFGEDCLAESGVINEIYYLIRTEREDGEISLAKANPKELAEICTNILLHEWHQSMHYLYLYSALTPITIDSIHAATRIIFEELFCLCPCYIMEIPNSMANRDYQNELMEYLIKRS